MHLCIAELRAKDVVNKKTGARLGNVGDVRVDTCTGCIISLVIYGKMRGFFSREECYVPWENIEVIGDDIILVNHSQVECEPGRKHTIDGMFR